MVAIAAIFSEPITAGPPIHVGPTIVTLVLFTGWFVFNLAAFAYAAACVRAVFGRNHWRAAWTPFWKACLMMIASSACCFVFNTWINGR